MVHNLQVAKTTKTNRRFSIGVEGKHLSGLGVEVDRLTRTLDFT